jgi:hypothetical protein
VQGTGAHAEHKRQERSSVIEVPTNHAEHTQKELVRILNIASGPDAYAEHTHQFLARMLSMRVRN